MIKKEKKHFNATINDTKLYLEDIENIISKIDKDDVKIEISDNDNIYESLFELKSIKGSNPKLIKIEGTLKNVFLEYINIRITEFSSSITVHNSEFFLKSAYEIEKYLLTKKRKFIYSFFNSYTAKIHIIFNLIISLIHYLVNELFLKKEFNYSIWIVLILFWVIIFIFSELNPNSSPKIELERKHELNFYEKNKDKILFGIVTTIIGIIIGSIVTYFKT